MTTFHIHKKKIVLWGFYKQKILKHRQTFTMTNNMASLALWENHNVILAKINTWCNAGLPNLPFWEVLRNERNTNTDWEDLGFIAATLHQIYEVLNMQDTLQDESPVK